MISVCTPLPSFSMSKTVATSLSRTAVCTYAQINSVFHITLQKLSNSDCFSQCTLSPEYYLIVIKQDRQIIHIKILALPHMRNLSTSKLTHINAHAPAEGCTPTLKYAQTRSNAVLGITAHMYCNAYTQLHSKKAPERSPHPLLDKYHTHTYVCADVQ
jgi:hypothetical protein